MKWAARASLPKRALLFWVGCFFIPALAFPAQDLTEPGAVAAALKNNAGLQQARADMEAARARLYEGISAFLPRISLNGRYNQLNEPQFSTDLPAFLAGLPPSLTGNQYYDAALSVKQPLLAWGANYHRFQEGSHDFALARAKYDQHLAGTAFQAKTLYYRVLLATAAAAIAREALELSLRRLHTTQEQELRGKVSRYERSRAAVAVTNDRVAVSKAEKDLRRALSELKSYIRSPENITMSGTLPFVPQTRTLAGTLATARGKNPQLQQARAALAGAQAELGIAQAGFLPGLSASYTRTWQRPYAADGAVWDNRWQAQLAVEWNVFAGLDQAAAWQRASGHVQGAQAALEAAQSALELDVQSAYLDYEQALESLKLQEENIALADSNRALAEEKFNLGMISSLELQDVQLALSQARLNYQQALYDYAVAVASLDRLCGLPDKE